MKTHPITDHVPESELTAITPEGAARWLTGKGWTHDGAGFMGEWFSAEPGVLACVPSGDVQYANRVAALVGRVADHMKLSPRTIIAEMQADSRIAAECARMAGRRRRQHDRH